MIATCRQLDIDLQLHRVFSALTLISNACTTKRNRGAQHTQEKKSFKINLICIGDLECVHTVCV